MAELDPRHPVERFRFVTRRSPAPAADACGEGDDTSAENTCERDATTEPADLEAAREAARAVGDQRLRDTIEAALRAASPPPPRPLRGGPEVNPKK